MLYVLGAMKFFSHDFLALSIMLIYSVGAVLRSKP